MPDIVGIRFKRAGKVYYFDPVSTELKTYDHVVVQTARGMEIGEVMIAPKQVLASEITAELKPIVRKASPEDIKRAKDFAAKEPHAVIECNKMVARLKLPMKLVSAEYNLDGTRLTFYFTSEERVDFRELVRELTSYFKTRIELRQIGPRDQAKIVGGLGRCGRALCCASHLGEFNPVSIRMAKEQDLPLDPMKISGVCGRLQCCLAYENDQYREAKALLPRRGQQVNTPAGVGFVVGGNPLKETVLVEMESQAAVEFPLSQVTIMVAAPPALALPAVPVKQEAAAAPAATAAVASATAAATTALAAAPTAIAAASAPATATTAPVAPAKQEAAPEATPAAASASAETPPAPAPTPVQAAETELKESPKEAPLDKL